MSFRLHIIPVSGGTTSAVNLSFGEDFAVVAGQTPAGGLVLPTAPNVRYLIAGGIAGLKYHEELGQAGGRYDFAFPEPVLAVLVATYSAQEPVPQLVFVPTAPAVPVVAGGGRSQTFYLPDSRMRYTFNVFWSIASSDLPTLMQLELPGNAPQPEAPANGLTLAEVLALGYVAFQPISQG